MGYIELLEFKKWRERALHPRHKPTKAEKFFDKVLDTPGMGITIAGKDLQTIRQLFETYWELQDEILDENSDAQTQLSCINQQHDILDEMEVIYNKYYEKRNE